jgi:hypothetical protein
LTASNRNYVNHLRNAGAGREATPTGKARTALLEAQARLAERKEAVLKGDYILRAEVVREQKAMIDITRGRILALPSRLAGILPHLTRDDIGIMDAEVRALLTELADPESYDLPAAAE